MKKNPVSLYFQLRPLATLLQVQMELPEDTRKQAEEALQQLLESWYSQQELYLSQLRQQLALRIPETEDVFPPLIEKQLLAIQQFPIQLFDALQSLVDARDQAVSTDDSQKPTDPAPVV